MAYTSVEISGRETEKNCYILYQIDGFYIEMKFFKDSYEEPVMRIFSKERRLQPYLQKININEIFSIVSEE